MADIELRTPQGIFTGWESMRLNLGLDQLSGAFELSVSGVSAQELLKHPLTKGLECKVYLHQQLVLTGYINRRSPSYDKQTHSLSIAGRDVTCDLVDCSASVPNQELHNVTIAEAARQLIAPFPAIRLDCPEAGKPFAKFTVQDGDTIFSVLETHAKQRGFMIYTTGDGVLHIRRPEVQSNGLVLEEGVNILTANAEDSDEELFSTYIVRGQDSDNAKHQAEQRYTDKGVRTGRVRIITAEKPESSSDIKNRAEWEAKLRKARSYQANVTIQGWITAQGRLVRLGEALKLHSPSLGAYQQSMVINNLAYEVDANNGSTAALGLVLPEVFVYGQD